MASSEQQCLRFFVLACAFGLFVGVLGCATNNWSQPLFDPGTQVNQSQQVSRQYAEDGKSSSKVAPLTLKQTWNRFWNAGFGSSVGSDPRAREIEQSLGF